MSFDIETSTITQDAFHIVCSNCNWKSMDTRYMTNAMYYWNKHKCAHD